MRIKVLALCLLAVTGVAQAQESVAASPASFAGPTETPVCIAASDVGQWNVSNLPSQRPAGDAELRAFWYDLNGVLRTLHAVCAGAPENLTEALKKGEAADWLVDADNRAQELLEISIDAWELRYSGTPAQRKARPGKEALLDLQNVAYKLNGRLNRLRWAAYDAVTVKVVEKEVPVEKVITKRDDRDVACRNAVNSDVGETQAFLATILQENNPFVGLFEEASRGSDSQFGPIIRQTKRAMLRERIEASLDSLRTIRNSCSY